MGKSVLKFNQSRYLSRQKLPKSMLKLRNGVGTDFGGDSEEDEGSDGSKKRCLSTEIVQRKPKGPKNCPFLVGNLEVLKLGKLVKNLDCFDVEKSIRPLGYTATRKFPSLTDPSVCSVYKMEVLRDAGTKNRHVFRVTTDDGDQGFSSHDLKPNMVFSPSDQIGFSLHRVHASITTLINTPPSSSYGFSPSQQSLAVVNVSPNQFFSVTYDGWHGERRRQSLDNISTEEHVCTWDGTLHVYNMPYMEFC